MSWKLVSSPTKVHVSFLLFNLIIFYFVFHLFYFTETYGNVSCSTNVHVFLFYFILFLSYFYFILLSLWRLMEIQFPLPQKTVCSCLGICIRLMCEINSSASEHRGFRNCRRSGLLSHFSFLHTSTAFRPGAAFFHIQDVPVPKHFGEQGKTKKSYQAGMCKQQIDRMWHIVLPDTICKCYLWEKTCIYTITSGCQDGWTFQHDPHSNVTLNFA